MTSLEKTSTWATRSGRQPQAQRLACRAPTPRYALQQEGRDRLACGRHPWSTRAHSDRGAALVEMVLLSPILILLVFGAGDFGRLWYHAITLTHAARAGAAWGAQSNGHLTDITGIKLAAEGEAQNIGPITVTSQRVCECAAGAVVACTTSSCAGYGGTARIHRGDGNHDVYAAERRVSWKLAVYFTQVTPRCCGPRRGLPRLFRSQATDQPQRPKRRRHCCSGALQAVFGCNAVAWSPKTTARRWPRVSAANPDRNRLGLPE